MDKAEYVTKDSFDNEIRSLEGFFRGLVDHTVKNAIDEYMKEKTAGEVDRGKRWGQIVEGYYKQGKDEQSPMSFYEAERIVKQHIKNDKYANACYQHGIAEVIKDELNKDHSYFNGFMPNRAAEKYLKIWCADEKIVL